MHIRSFATFASAVSFALIFTSCSTRESIAPPPPSSSPDITADEVRYHVSYLASDELEGRGTGTAGNDRAADYLAREFERYGLEPAGENGSYFQTFDVVTGVEAGDRNRCVVAAGGKTQTLDMGKDFIPYGFSMAGSASGPVVFVGYGITSPPLNHDDYKGADVKGKIVLALAGAPESDDPHTDYSSVASVRSKALFAREAGAAALFVVAPDKPDLAPLKYDNAPSNTGLLTVNVKTDVADFLLAAAGQSVKQQTELRGKGAALPAVALGAAHADVTVDVALVRKPTRNVVGWLPGKNPAAGARYIIIGGHYDHLGWGQDGSLYKGATPMIHNGADDNASGAAGVLELAQYYAAHPPRHAMLFMGFTGEEMGLLGSAYWVEHPTRPLGEAMAMINFDMIGRLADSTRKLNVQGTGTSPVWEAWVKEANTGPNFDIAMIPDGQGASDHSSFYMKNIPVLFIFTGLHTDYHRPSDDADKINTAGEERVIRFGQAIISRLDEHSEPIAFTKVKVSEDRKVRGFNVYVGTIPDYGYQGEGFRISGTSPGGPAEKAGLQANDILVRFGDTAIKNIYDYMNALSLHKPGEEVNVEVRRGAGVITLAVVLGKK